MSTLRNAIAITAERAADLVAGPQAEISDGSLVVRALDGDAWAEEALFRRHFPPVMATVTRMLGSRQDAEDVAQETFVTALSRMKSLREPDAFRGWVVRIAVRKVHRVFRRQKLLRTLGLGGDTDQCDYAELAAADASPEIHAELGLLGAVLAELGPAERVAWTLRHVEGHKLEQLAVACGCSLATAKRRIASADRHIRAHITFAELDDE